MRVLYVAAGIPVPGSHGGSIHALELCRGLAALGHEVHLAAQPGEGTLDDLVGLRLHAVSPAPLEQLEWTRHRQVRRIAELVEPAVIIERFYTFGGAGAIVASALGIPLVLEINSPARPYPGSLRDRLDALTLLRPIDRWRNRVLDRARAYYGSSPVLVEAGRRDRFHVIPNGGVDCERVRPGAPAPDSTPLELLHVSSFRAWHGAEDLVRALALALEQGADVRLTCIGTGPREAAARELAGSLGLGERICFRGRVGHGEVVEELARAHVGVAPFNPAMHSALQLGWYWSPLKIYEYLAAGLPVITADIEALRDELGVEVAHYYESGNPDGLAAQIVALEADRAAVRSVAEVARELAETSFTWARHAESLGDLLQTVVRS